MIVEYIRYEVEPGHFTVRIEWRSLEEQEKGFRGGAQFPALFTKVKPFFDQSREMKHYRLVGGVPGGSVQ